MDGQTLYLDKIVVREIKGRCSYKLHNETDLPEMSTLLVVLIGPCNATSTCHIFISQPLRASSWYKRRPRALTYSTAHRAETISLNLAI